MRFGTKLTGPRVAWVADVFVSYRYRRRIQAAAARAAKRVTRVLARGRPFSQCATRETLTAAAVQTCWRPVLARPMERLRRRPKARTPCESVPSTPARLR